MGICPSHAQRSRSPGWRRDTGRTPRQFYGKPAYDNIRPALRALTALYSGTRAADFGPLTVVCDLTYALVAVMIIVLLCLVLAWRAPPAGADPE